MLRHKTFVASQPRHLHHHIHPLRPPVAAEDSEHQRCSSCIAKFEGKCEACTGAGLSLSTIVMDGNSKLAGRICGRPASEVLEKRELNMFTVTCCSAEPARKKRRCMKHDLRQPEDPYPTQSELITAHRRVRRLIGHGQPKGHPELRGRWAHASMVTPTQLHEYWQGLEAQGFVPEMSSATDLSASACQTHKEKQAFTKKQVRQGRCNGFLFATTPCGHVLHCKPFTGAESLSQRYFFLSEVVEALPPRGEEPLVLIHDDSCHLRRFAAKHARKSPLTEKLQHPHVRYIVDRLHIKGHVDAWCLRECHPDVPGNMPFTEGVQTSAAATLNSLMSRHRTAVRCMGRLMRSFFIHEVVETRNTCT